MPVCHRSSQLLFVVLLALASPAAALQQPNGDTIPSQLTCVDHRPTGLAAELACVCDPGQQCNWGAPCDASGNCPIPTGTCETSLWHAPGDDHCIPSQLGGLDPWADAALTPETFTPTCALTFTIVTRGTAIFHNAFGWYNVRADGQPPSLNDLHVMLDCRAAPGDNVILDVRNDPAYAGGELGFFLATPEDRTNPTNCIDDNCCATIDQLRGGQGYVYYSQRSLNPDEAGSDSFIHLLVLDSEVTPRKFYFAWEDMYGGNSNDFTDLVTSVSGLECAGGGNPCDTGLPGVCSHGITVCTNGGTITCEPIFPASDELCDGADNDCDQEIDEGGVCSDDVIIGCEEIDCPTGSICRYGECVDPCDQVECPPGQLCRGGVCFPGCNQCDGLTCAAGIACDLASGMCEDELVDPTQDAGPSDAPVNIDAAPWGPADASGHAGDTDANTSIPGIDASGPAGSGTGAGQSSCGCRTTANPGQFATWLLLAGALLWARRKRR